MNIFKVCFVMGISMVQNLFDVGVLDFQIGIWSRYFEIFWFGNCFGYFSKNWVIFFQYFGHSAYMLTIYSSKSLHSPILNIKD